MDIANRARGERRGSVAVCYLPCPSCVFLVFGVVNTARLHLVGNHTSIAPQVIAELPVGCTSFTEHEFAARRDEVVGNSEAVTGFSERS